jgi:hypothetical protein
MVPLKNIVIIIINLKENYCSKKRKIEKKNPNEKLTEFTALMK